MGLFERSRGGTGDWGCGVRRSKRDDEGMKRGKEKGIGKRRDGSGEGNTEKE